MELGKVGSKKLTSSRQASRGSKMRLVVNLLVVVVVVVVVAVVLAAARCGCSETVGELEFAEVQKEATFSRDKRDERDSQSNAIPAANPSFEAAFQGKCGDQTRPRQTGGGGGSGGNPCEHTCMDLHDGTYECSCLAGFTLAVDGYSCTARRPGEPPGSSSQPAKRNKTAPKEAEMANSIRRRSSSNEKQQQDDDDRQRVSFRWSTSSSVAPEARRLGLLSAEFQRQQQQQRRRRPPDVRLLDLQNDNKTEEPDQDDDDDGDRQELHDKRKLASTNLMDARGATRRRLASVSAAAVAANVAPRQQVERRSLLVPFPVSEGPDGAASSEREPKRQIKEEERDLQPTLQDDDHHQDDSHHHAEWHRLRESSGDDRGDVRSIKLANDRLLEALQEALLGSGASDEARQARRTTGGDRRNGNNDNNNNFGSDAADPQGVGDDEMTTSKTKTLIWLDEASQADREDRQSGPADGQHKQKFDYDLSLLEALINKTINGRPSRDYSGHDDDDQHHEQQEGANEATAWQRNRSDQPREDQRVSLAPADWSERRSMSSNAPPDDNNLQGDELENNDDQEDEDAREEPPALERQRVGLASSKQVPVTSSGALDDDVPGASATTMMMMMDTQDDDDDDDMSESDNGRPETKPAATSCLEMAECESGGECTEDEHEKPTGGDQRQARCRCPIGRGGDLCQRLVQRDVPKFSGLSYLALPMTTDSQLAYLSLDFKPIKRPTNRSLANQASILLSTSRFALVMDSTNRVELRYLQLSNHINATREQLTRVIGSRDVLLNRWNQLVVTDASSDQTLEITEDADDDHDDDDNEEDREEDQRDRANKIVLVMPDKIHLDDWDELSARQKKNRHHRYHPNTELFVGGLPEKVLANYQARESDINNNDLIRSESVRGDDRTRRLIRDKQSGVFGFTGCISSLQVNDRSYNMRSDLNGDALDGFDLGECQ